MPLKDPEKRREYERQYRQANRDRVRARGRENDKKRQNNATRLEKKRAAAKAYYWANRDLISEKSRKWREANPDRVRENMARWRANGGNPHRRRVEATDHFWHEQDGRCYLCGELVPREDAVLEHDHRCCPRLKFCDFCVRGVACHRCNHVVGHAGDDPVRLELIAANLRAKLADVDRRLAIKPEQTMINN